MSDDSNQTALTHLKTKRDDVYAFKIDGHMTRDDVEGMFQTLEQAYEKHDKINLLIHIDHYEGFDWHLFLSEKTYQGKLHAMRHIHRYALVGGPAWAATATAFFNPMFRIEVRHFEEEHEDQAWTWVYEPLDADQQTEADS